MYWTTSSGKIELNITKAQAAKASHMGDCDRDVFLVSQEPAIRRQLNKIEPVLLREELKQYGAWDDYDLADHVQNLQRLLWIACGDIAEGA